jgi:hypothetical protein
LIATRCRLLLLTTAFVGYGQFLSAFSTACSQYATTVSGSHSLQKAVFVTTLALRGLECTFHCFISLILFNNRFVFSARLAKRAKGLQRYDIFFIYANIRGVFFKKVDFQPLFRAHYMTKWGYFHADERNLSDRRNTKKQECEMHSCLVGDGCR